VITAEVKVDETDIVNVRLSQSGEVSVDAFPNQTFQGKVTEIGTTAIIRSTGLAAAQSNVASQEAKDFKVVVTLESPPDTLRPGLSTTAKVRTASKQDVLVIPIQALTIRQKSDLDEDEEKGSSADAALAAGPEARQKQKEGKKEIQGVFVVRDKQVEFVPVETGIIGSTDIEVLNGLEEGKEIVTGSYKVLRTIRNHARVRVDNEAPKKED
jgi:HlyD family secretion protein